MSFSTVWLQGEGRSKPVASKSEGPCHVLSEMPRKELVRVPVFRARCSPILGKERRDQPATASQSCFRLSQENAERFANMT